MNLQLASLIVVAAATLLGVARSLRSTGGRRWLRVGVQVASGVALALLLVPPSVTRDRETAVVFTAGVTAAQRQDIDAQSHVIVLPEASQDPDRADAVADLGTALRQHPEIGQLRILGDGLPARDRDATAGLGVAFEPGEEPTGLVELQVPRVVNAGVSFPVSGRVSGIPNARVELVDRSDAVVASATIDGEGRFRMSTTARLNTPMLYRLRTLDAAGTMIEDVPVAVAGEAGDALRIQLVAGAPDAELKYLRRWMIDAGHSLGSQIALSRGIEQRQSAAALDPATLAETDLLILDERSWAALSSSARVAVRATIESGMGLLLRVTGPVPDRVAEEWAALGITAREADIARTVGFVENAAEHNASRTFTRRPVALEGADSVPLLKASDGSDLARWSALGRGRVGIWLPLDSYRMALEGDREGHGTLWSRVFATLARARSEAAPVLPRQARIDQRSVICGLQPDASIEGADGIRHALLVDDGEGACAAWWPAAAGWHELVNGETRWPVYVLDRDEALSIQRTETREATAALVRDPPDLKPVSVELPRWPFFLGWLVLTAMLWWLERRTPPQRVEWHRA